MFAPPVPPAEPAPTSKVRLGVKRARSAMLRTLRRSSPSPEIAVSEIGTVCEASSRLRAVTMISSTTEPSEVCADASE